MSLALSPVLVDRWARSVPLTAMTVVGAAALTALAAQIAIPVPGSPVPVTGQTFAVLLTAAALGPWRGMAGQAVYLLAALIGLPVLAQGSGGATAVFGATGGYLLGFVAAAGVVGWLARLGWSRTPIRVALAYLVGSVVIYAFGLTGLMLATGQGLGWAFSKGVAPFVVGDLLKAGLAAGVLPLAWSFVGKRS